MQESFIKTQVQNTEKNVLIDKSTDWINTYAQNCNKFLGLKVVTKDTYQARKKLQ